jgi:hypothetical protein
MIKTLTIVSALMVSVSLQGAPITITKQNGGLFGYKNTEQTNYNDGSIFLKCTDPGVTRCKIQNLTARITYNGQQTTISDETMDAIDAKVMESITISNTHGKILIDNALFVSYTYNVTTNTIHYLIYVKAEAQALGLI